MKRESIWRKFEKSGSVFDYLEYACTCEEDMQEAVNSMTGKSAIAKCTTTVDGDVCVKADVSSVYRTDI